MPLLVFRRVKVNGKYKRRRGKPLVGRVFIAEDDERKQEFRCQVVREQPFRSTSNDVAQSTDRCNVDYQFLSCAPPLPTDGQDSDATQLAACNPSEAANVALQPAAGRRLRTKTRPGATKYGSRVRHKKPPWFPASMTLSSREQRCIQSFAASFQKAAAMDFYITKYQGKPMESLTPLFKALTEGIHRLQSQEAKEEEEVLAREDEKADASTDGHSVEAEPARKKPKTMEDSARRCRRLTIRLASMANRCFWLSAAELLIHVFADGDCLQSHKHVTVFTKQLQWAMQQCKSALNKDIPEESRYQEFRNVEAVAVHVTSGIDEKGASQPLLASVPQPGEDDDDDDGDDNVDIVKMEAMTTSTNASDDYAHRGPKLRTLTLYMYRMYVRRVPKPSRSKMAAPTFFCFEPHYALSRSYVQEVMLHTIAVPTIDGFQCPTVEQDAEQNALFKSIFFTPWSCTNPMTCGHVSMYQGHLSNGNDSEGGTPQSARAYTFERAWKLRCSEILVLAHRAQCRCMAARKRLVLADTTLFADMKEPKDKSEADEVRKVLRMIYLMRLRRTPPFQGIRIILAFLALPCKWHEEQCTVAEFTAYWSRDVLAHIDLAAEARVKKPSKPLQPDQTDSDIEDDLSATKPRELELVDLGGGDNIAANIADEEVPLGEVSSFPLADPMTTLSLCFQEAELAALDTKKKERQI